MRSVPSSARCGFGRGARQPAEGRPVPHGGGRTDPRFPQPKDFWAGFADIVHDLAPKNRALLKKRDDMQEKIDPGTATIRGLSTWRLQGFLREIGYLVPEGPAFKVTTRMSIPKSPRVAGPQLVVPVMNARYALNAANARWGSLYDALYGTDAISDADGAEKGKGYNPKRGAKVIAWARKFLDDSRRSTARLDDATGFAVEDGKLAVTCRRQDDRRRQDPGSSLPAISAKGAPTQILLRNNGLGIEILIDATSTDRQGRSGQHFRRLAGIGADHHQDCEDSVAAVDAEDKVVVYRNWLGLMKGDLTGRSSKGGKTFTRKLNPTSNTTAPDGSKFAVCRSLMLVRNVGHLMTNPAILDKDGNEVPEGIMDAMITALIALHDIGPKGRRARIRAPARCMSSSRRCTGRRKSPSPSNCSAASKSCSACRKNTIKMGIMDEERRTTVNLKECIRAAKERVVFINTGFLDRTGDEIHTSMEAGPMIRKGDMKQAAWIRPMKLERRHRPGMRASGRAQIGKGMWAMPDLMAAMLEQKIAHPKAGANTAWVPSPTAATLHATHYHKVDVHAVQES
jgi:malate synthase